jgi:hypothetical protein
MTREEWAAEWDACFKRLRAKGYDPLAAWKEARALTTARYGSQPDKPPLWLRIGLKIAGKKLAGLRPVEEVTMKQRLIVAALYGAGVVVAALQLKVPATKGEWLALGAAFVGAAWGKFSSSQTIFAPNRPEWTPEQRAAELGK